MTDNNQPTPRNERVTRPLSAFITGLLFGAGLVVAGMTRPEKVLGFLDVFGVWDPSLAFVMLSAIGVYAVSRWLVLRRRAPLFDTQFHVPTNRVLDARLLAGSAVFGVGWGLGGYCPGPALVAATSGALAPFVFVTAMTLGAVVHARTNTRGVVPASGVPRDSVVNLMPGDSR